MTPRTVNLLKNSIAHWWRMANGQRAYNECIGSQDCALCRTYIHQSDCGNCPVRIHTGHPLCKGTPYTAARQASHYGERYDSLYFMAAAMKEFKFLVTLLPKGQSWIDPEGWEWYAK